MLPARHVQFLKLLRRYFYARARHFRDALLPEDKDGAVTRSVLRKLERAGLVRRYQPRMTDPSSGGAPPVFVLTQKGASALAAATGDVRLIMTQEASFRDWMSINHYCALTSLHLLIDDAIVRQKEPHVTLKALHFEHEVVNPDAEDSTKHFRLATLVSGNPRILCCPDSALETDVGGYRRAWLTEFETGSDTPGRAAAKKNKGYCGMIGQRLFAQVFPHAKDARVLAFCPYESWMNALRKEVKKYPGGAEYWLFSVTPNLTAANFLHGNVFYSVDRGPFPLVPAPADSSALLSRGGTGRGAEGGTPS